MAFTSFLLIDIFTKLKHSIYRAKVTLDIVSWLVHSNISQ
uniref:Uncharacterized protein n=1 Tax=Anguilla anguilla TaxID=7936 RepID=A0A0E9PXV6_ANGAN